MNDNIPLHRSNTVIWLSALTIFLVPIVTIAGLFWEDGGSSFSLTTLRGDLVQIYGRGFYRYDPILTAIGFTAILFRHVSDSQPIKATVSGGQL